MSKIEKLVSSIEQMIASGVLRPGDRLPSLRQASENHGVAKNTVVEAYGRLVAKQIVDARPGAGFFVAKQLHHNENRPVSVTEASDALSLLRAQLNQEFTLRPGDGRPPQSWMRDSLPKRLDTTSLLDDAHDHTGYGDPQGHARLRELIARRFASQGISVTPSKVVTTFGANHALDLIIRRYLSPGQTVLVDDPGYYPLFAKLRLAQIKMIPVRRIATGPDLDQLETLAHRHAPRLYFTQSTAQNPTGSTYDLQTAHAALQIAAKHGFRLVDDDPFIDLHGPAAIGSRLWELDGFRNVIFIGTYSKLLSASLRSGYVVSDKRTVDQLTEFKLITSVNSSRLSEMLIAQMIETGRYDRHLKRLDRHLAQAKKACLEEFQALGLDTFTEQPAGYYTLLNLPADTDIDTLQSQARNRSVFIALSQWFSPEESRPAPSMRINFCRSADQRFFSFIRAVLPK